MTEIFCTCGGVAKIQRTQIMNDSELWACWVECTVCHKKGLPAILDGNAIWYWDYDKKKGRSNANTK